MQALPLVSVHSSEEPERHCESRRVDTVVSSFPDAGQRVLFSLSVNGSKPTLELLHARLCSGTELWAPPVAFG